MSKSLLADEIRTPRVAIKLVDGRAGNLLDRKPHLDEVIRVRVIFSKVLRIHPTVRHEPVAIAQAPQLVSHPRGGRLAGMVRWEQANSSNDFRANQLRFVTTQPAEHRGVPQM